MTDRQEAALAGNVETYADKAQEQMAASEEPILRYFEFAHLPDHLQSVSQVFYQVAHHIVRELPRNPERSTALRKLLESKDAAVRAALD